jgi:hypothetical protein
VSDGVLTRPTEADYAILQDEVLNTALDVWAQAGQPEPDRTVGHPEPRYTELRDFPYIHIGMGIPVSFLVYDFPVQVFYSTPHERSAYSDRTPAAALETLERAYLALGDEVIDRALRPVRDTRLVEAYLLVRKRRARD